MSEFKPTRHSNRPVANAEIKALVDIVEAEDRKTARRGGYKVTEEQFAWALDRIASGDTVRNVSLHLQITRSALRSRANGDPDFAARLDEAQAMGAWARLENAEDRLINGTGSVERDKAIMDYAKWMAARLDRRTFGDRVQVDATHTIAPVMLPSIALPSIPDAEFDDG